MKFYNVPEVRKQLKEALDIAEKDENKVYIKRKDKFYLVSLSINQEAVKEEYEKHNA